MPEELEIRGVVAEIRWAYHVAARVQGYRMTIDKKTGAGTFVGTAVESHASHLAQQPLELVARGLGRFALSQVTLEPGATIRATVTRQQEGG